MKTNDTGWLGIAAATAALIVAMTCTAAPAWQQWPKQTLTNGGQILMYQPQIETYKGDFLSARAAVSVTLSLTEEPVFGMVWFEGIAHTDRASRTVDMIDTQVTRVRFPDGITGAAELAQILESQIPRWSLHLSLDEVMTSLAFTEAQSRSSDDLSNEAPVIIFSTVPAFLVVLDGEPVMARVDETDLMRIVNTPFIVLLDTDTRTYYLKAGDAWMKTRDMYGAWEVASKVPAAAVAIAEDTDVSSARGMKSVPKPLLISEVPAIVIATEPTELVVTDGQPEFQMITGTSLLYVSNTDNDLFLDISTQDMYLLLAGRWFTASRKEGPWRYIAAENLPAIFASIPPYSIKGHVLASIPGTDQAMDAVADAYAPRTAAVRRSEAAVTVVYDGPPRFEPITGTTMFYAVNSPYYVILAGGRYYCCDNAVWFVSSGPVGPWIVCDTVPAVIYTIPPACPVYPVRYVYVYHYTPQIVYVGYTPGYAGCYVYRGRVVYGTGYRYRGWYRTVYYPRPVTWGFAFRYSTYSGWNIGISFNWGGCFGPARVDYVYGGWWGCGGFRLHDRHHHRRDNVIVIDRRDYDRIPDYRRRIDVHRDRVINVYSRRTDVVVRDTSDRQRRSRPAEYTVRDRIGNTLPTETSQRTYRSITDTRRDTQRSGWPRQTSPDTQRTRTYSPSVTRDRREPTRIADIITQPTRRQIPASRERADIISTSTNDRSETRAMQGGTSPAQRRSDEPASVTRPETPRRVDPPTPVQQPSGTLSRGRQKTLERSNMSSAPGVTNLPQRQIAQSSNPSNNSRQTERVTVERRVSPSQNAVERRPAVEAPKPAQKAAPEAKAASSDRSESRRAASEGKADSGDTGESRRAARQQGAKGR